MKSFKIVVMLVAVTLFASCATIIHGSKQHVSISSNPSAAVVTIDATQMGVTPFSTKLSRKDQHSVRIELDGYMPYEAQFNRKVDAWIAGNIVFGGLIGLAVDAITGGMYKLTPDQIQAELRANTVTAQEDEDGIFLTVVLEPKPEWEKVGQLTKANE